MITRQAAPQEAAAIFTAPAGSELWVVLVDDDGIKGHLCLSRSPYGVFGHNTTFETPAQALALWRAARRQLKAWGVNEYFVHLEPGHPARIAEFWMKHTKPAYLVLRGEL